MKIEIDVEDHFRMEICTNNKALRVQPLNFTKYDHQNFEVKFDTFVCSQTTV